MMSYNSAPLGDVRNGTREQEKSSLEIAKEAADKAYNETVEAVDLTVRLDMVFNTKYLGGEKFLHANKSIDFEKNITDQGVTEQQAVDMQAMHSFLNNAAEIGDKVDGPRGLYTYDDYDRLGNMVSDLNKYIKIYNDSVESIKDARLAISEAKNAVPQTMEATQEWYDYKAAAGNETALNNTINFLLGGGTDGGAKDILEAGIRMVEQYKASAEDQDFINNSYIVEDVKTFDVTPLLPDSMII